MTAADVLNWLGTVVLCSVSYWIAFQRGRRYENTLLGQTCESCKRKREIFLAPIMKSLDLDANELKGGPFEG